MKRRTFLSMLAATVVALVMTFAATSHASAQPQNLKCCTYTIEIAKTIPAACFPLKVDVEWGPGIVQSWAFAGPGVYPLNVPPPCPPAFPFNWVQVLPGGPIVTLGGAGTYLLPGCNYLVTYVAKTDANGCIYITIF